MKSMNIVGKNITTLPIEICDIIYQYYKPQYIIDIENPFTKYCLKKWYLYGEPYSVRTLQTKKFNYDTYHIPLDNKRRTILPQSIITHSNFSYQEYNCYEGWYRLKWYDLKDKNYRKKLIDRCNENGIEVRPKEHTKRLIKKLLKL